MSNRLCNVREASFSDITGIFETLTHALSESCVSLPEPDDPYCRQYTMDLIAQRFVWVAEDPRGEIVGVLMLAWTRWPWTSPHNENAMFLQNEHFWVAPRYRKGGTAVRLIECAKERARELGKPLWLDITYGNDGQAEEKDRFVKQRGFGYAGGKFYMLPVSEPDGQKSFDLQCVEPA